MRTHFIGNQDINAHTFGMAQVLRLLSLLLILNTATMEEVGDDKTLKTLVAGNNQFAFDMCGQLKVGQNIVFAPWSVSTLMGMLYLGAGGKTKEQIRQKLYFDSLPDAEVHKSFKSLNASLSNSSCLLFAANKLYGQPTKSSSDEYTSSLMNFYETEFIESDFTNEPETVRKDINSWVFQVTRGKIENLVAEGSIDPRTSMVLVNAVYFKGDWLHAFDEGNTAVDLFHITNEKSIHTHLMYQSQKFNYGYSEILRSKVLELPYRDGRLAMSIILPDTVEGIQLLENKLLSSVLNTLDLYKTKVDVYLPKFNIEYSFSVKDALITLGVSDLFHSGICDLSGIDPSRNLFVSKIIHKAYIEVNEVGTEAAAATHANIMKRSIPEPPELFVADHPFVFVIRDSKTNSILFLGRLTEPDSLVVPKDEL